MRVDAQVSGLDGARYCSADRRPREYRPDKPNSSVVGKLNCLRLVVKGITATTGPNTSSRQMRLLGSSVKTTVGANQNQGPSGREPKNYLNVVDVALHGGLLCRRNEGAHFAGAIRGVEYLTPCTAGSSSDTNRRRRSAPLQMRAGAVILPSIVEHCGRRSAAASV